MKALKAMLPVIAAALILAGCAGQQKELLAKDYLHMTNDQLLRYYYQLSDEINRCQSRSGPSVGIGTGFGILRWLGLGVGVSQPVSSCDSTKLSERRIDVRMELHRRGVNP